jgi:alkylhydroperoxidase family enzyme
VTRITPLEPPYADDIGEELAAMMPAGVAPIALFRTLIKNRTMTTAMRPWGGYELSRDLTLSLRQREIIIDRTCARCRCEYEWGIHVAFFADRAGLDAAQITSLTHGGPTDPCWTDPVDRLLIEAADQLHDNADLDDAIWPELERQFDERQLLDVLLLAGWYHAISYVATATRLATEPGAPRFTDAAP